MNATRYLLAIETSTRQGSVAVRPVGSTASAGQVAFAELPAEGRTAATLAPTISRLLEGRSIATRDLAAIAVTCGPGSFTGLRIGVTAAKTLAYAAGCNVAMVNTLELLAYQCRQVDAPRLWAVMDAQRGDLFAGCFESPSSRQPISENDPTQLVSVDDWLAVLRDGDTIVGRAARKYADPLPTNVRLVDEKFDAPRADALAELVVGAMDDSLLCDPFAVVPRYYRPSAAEEKRLATG